MKEIGARLLVKTVQGLAAGILSEVPQHNVSDGDRQIHHAPKIFTETCKIDFTNTVEVVHNLIRGLSPFPGAFTSLNGKTLKVFSTLKEITTPEIQPGEYKTDRKTFFKYACTNGYIIVKELQLEGKKKMTIEEFLRGSRII
jgi:methionyl-tRNA formyltransferase